MKKIQPILDAEEESRREYPMAGPPLLTEVIFPKSNNRENRWQPHIIYSKSWGNSAGEFLNYWVESEERAWEISMQKVVEIRKKGAHKR